MTKILNKIGISNNNPFFCSVGSNAAVGKTTILTMIAAELANEGKNVLYVTEDNPQYILRKLKNLVKKNYGQLVVLRNVDETKKISSMVNERDFDYVFLDIPSFVNENKIEEFRNLVNSKNISAFVSHQLSRPLEKSRNRLERFRPLRDIQISDYVILANKKTELSFFEKIKKFLFIKVPNITLYLIKNRHGKENSINIYVDFQKINKV